MGLFSKIFSNTRKPEGFWGRMIVSGMATAFETVYFWPEIEKSFAEVRRILSPGGIFLIVNEDDGLSGNNEKWEKMIEGMHTYTPDELRTHLAAAGFRDVAVHRNESKHWLCITTAK